MRLIIVITCMLFFMPGCSALNPLSMFTKKPSIEVNANVGKNVKQDKSVLKVETGTTNQNADQISNDTSYKADTVNQITNNLTPLQLLIIVIMAGAALPSFKEMYQGLKVIITDTLQAFIVKPITAIADFVLLLMGKERKPKVFNQHERRK